MDKAPTVIAGRRGRVVARTPSATPTRAFRPRRQTTKTKSDGTSFKLGTFTHHNSVTNGDLADYNPLENVRLTITLSGSVDATLQYTISLFETVNDDDPCMFPDAPNDPPCGEKVTIASDPLQTKILAIEGEQYTLEMVGFAGCDVPGAPTKFFYTHERAADKACLYARLVERTGL